jgi:peptidase M23-like protein
MTPRMRSVAALALGLAVPGAASAAGTTTGGTDYTPLPVISKVECVSHCSGKARVEAGGALKVTGRRLRQVKTVVFEGATSTTRDNVKVGVTPNSTRHFRVKVPYSAVTGPLTVRKSKTVRSEASDSVKILPPPAPEPSAELTPSTGPRDPGAPQLETGISSGKVFFAGTKVRFSYRVNDDEPVPVTIELVRVKDDVVVRSWDPGPVEPDTVHTIRWNGKAAPGLKASAGRYVFRVTAQSSDGALARSSSTTDATRDAFDFYGHIFPVRGPHNFGDSGARFGAGRSGHSHQGQDVFAKCGTKIVAARGGRVQTNAYQSAAGYYVVIDGKKTGEDYAYMHMEKKGRPKEGSRVKTGEMIGRESDTGDAQGCHLHFEIWSAPGWYEGGHVLNPTRPLKKWDKWS